MNIDRLPTSARLKPQRLKQPAAGAQPLKRTQVGVFDGTLEERIAAAFGKTNSGDVAIGEKQDARWQAIEGARRHC